MFRLITCFLLSFLLVGCASNNSSYQSRVDGMSKRSELYRKPGSMLVDRQGARLTQSQAQIAAAPVGIWSLVGNDSWRSTSVETEDTIDGYMFNTEALRENTEYTLGRAKARK